MAKSLVQGPQFEPLILTEQNDEYPQQEFNPFAHDLVVLNGHGSPEIAKNASVGDMISVLSRSNSACREPDRIGNVDEDVPPLILMYDLSPVIAPALLSDTNNATDDSKKIKDSPVAALLHQSPTIIGRNCGSTTIRVATTPIPSISSLEFDSQIRTANHMFSKNPKPTASGNTNITRYFTASIAVGRRS